MKNVFNWLTGATCWTGWTLVGLEFRLAGGLTLLTRLTLDWFWSFGAALLTSCPQANWGSLGLILADSAWADLALLASELLHSLRLLLFLPLSLLRQFFVCSF